ncbi:AfsR/SARP family transcriptional regulator [Paractinoplanes abujensis]|uniref:DNA-binding SARP family transcriptional activator n=1 Tax=Paractinoplanes abujensis TaxID=882441 RepID=A0A7W7CRY7_9ACTN|nr:BTAD domain-containing putative transcriptional regulator [Actinoplanes abujensis]MBB4693259.1 DNA-binding SARP family transcriptional activator [Actinoplanes abujensis]
MIEFQLLGPVEMVAGGRRVDAGQPRQRAILAALLADAGRPVPVGTLIERVWGPEPPRTVRASLQAHITRIRQTLEQAAAPGEKVITLGNKAGSYLLDVDPLQVDLHRFRHLAASGGLEPLRQAIGLWHGEPLADVSGAWAERARQAWRREHLAASVAWGRAELTANPAAVVPALGDLAREHPLNEALAAVVIEALAAAGQPAEALSYYEDVRRKLLEELGADPSAELQKIHRSILRGVAPPAPAPAAPAPAAPAQLPADVSGFAGRDDQLALLDDLLRTTPPGSLQAGPGAPVIAVSGVAGVGKTTLVVHWAHRVANDFPDGQLYVNLRGFDLSGRPMDPADAVRGFLDALGVPTGRIPAGLDAQAGLYRSLLSGRRILIVLDNARDAEQVRPLLPATPGALVVVTSRNRLTGLVATVGAHPVTLGVLSLPEARDLLSRRLGTARTRREPHAVNSIIASCARLPIALAITAARARQNDFPLAALAGELAGPDDRLDALDTGDPAVQVRAVFSWSYAALSDAAQRLFRLLSLHPGPDVATSAAAALGGQRPAQARRLLGELTQASLLAEHSPGRYSWHDLVRVYAGDLTAVHDSDADRDAATVRLIDYYAHTAHAADRMLYPARDPIDVPLPPDTGSGADAFTDHRQALAWFAAERPALLAVARTAAASGRDARAWQLAWALDTYLFRGGHRHDRLEAWTNALAGAERLGGEPLAGAHRSLSRANIILGRLDVARSHLGRALELSVRSGNRGGQAFVHNTLAVINGIEHQHAQALEHARKALALYEEAGNLRGQAVALSSMAWHSTLGGDHHEAIEYGQRSLAVNQRVGDKRGQADVWDTIGHAHHHLGRYDEARECYRRSVDLTRDIGDRLAEAQILVHLGDTHEAAGNPAAARGEWTDALRIFVDLDHTDAQGVRDRLEALPGVGHGLRPAH